MKVLKFGAAWCAGCLVMRPIWQEIAQAWPDLKTVYYDYDESQDEVREYKVNEKLPTFIFLAQDGHELLRREGEVSKAKLLKIIEENKDK